MYKKGEYESCLKSEIQRSISQIMNCTPPWFTSYPKQVNWTFVKLDFINFTFYQSVDHWGWKMMKELSFSTYFLRYILISTTQNVLLHASMLSMKHYLLSETQLQVRINYDIITTIMLSSINIKYASFRRIQNLYKIWSYCGYLQVKTWGKHFYPLHPAWRDHWIL